MKKFDLDEIAKTIWEKYLEKNVPPEGIPTDPIKHYGKHWKGWIWFISKNSNKIEEDLIDKGKSESSNILSNK